MCEFLVYNKIHDFDLLTVEQVMIRENNDPKFRANYDSRNQRGDPILCVKDGHYTSKDSPGFDKSAFILVCKPGMSVEEGEKYIESEIENDVIIKKRKYKFDLDAVSKVEGASTVDSYVEIGTLMTDKMKVTK